MWLIILECEIINFGLQFFFSSEVFVIVSNGELTKAFFYSILVTTTECTVRRRDNGQRGNLDFRGLKRGRRRGVSGWPEEMIFRDVMNSMRRI